MGRLRGAASRVAALAGAHRGIVVLLAAAAVVRLLFAVAYRPALFFSDSWSYVNLAWDSTLVGFAPDRPSGYPIFIKLVGGPGHSLAAITTVQHLIGLVSGALVYALLVRLRAPRWLALVAAGVVLFDGYAITLEQTLLPEAAVAVLLIGAMFLAVEASRAPERAWWLAGAGGVLLAVATTMRTAAIFAVPVWLIYLWVTRSGWRPPAVALAAVIAPLLVYSAAHSAAGGSFGINDASGWFLYGRVGEIADCDGVDVPARARPLCDRTEADRTQGALFHVWSPQSAANRHFKGVLSGDEGEDAALRDFSVAVIRERPGEYSRMVLSDFGRFFVPGEGSRGTSDDAIIPPSEARTAPPYMNTVVRDRHLPGFMPVVHAPDGLVRSYVDALHTPRWLMGLCALAALASLLLAIPRGLREAMTHHRETFLLTGSALSILLMSVATSEFIVRYLIPEVPLLVAGGALAARDLAAAAAVRRVRPSGAIEPAEAA